MGRGGSAARGMGLFYPFNHSEMTSGVQPSSPASTIQICPWPPALLGWDCPWGLSQIWPRARGWTRHMPGEHPHSLPTGTAARGGDLAEGAESSFSYFPPSSSSKDWLG